MAGDSNAKPFIDRIVCFLSKTVYNSCCYETCSLHIDQLCAVDKNLFVENSSNEDYAQTFGNECLLKSLECQERKSEFSSY